MSEHAIEEEVLEVEGNKEYDPDQGATNVEKSSDEEEGPPEVVVTLDSKNGITPWFPLIQRCQHLSQTPFFTGLVRTLQRPEARSMATRDRRDKKMRCNLCATRDNKSVKTSMMCNKYSAYICKADLITIVYCLPCA